jgi:EAL domain-containing protein (putative c-di-GMP-specific phosphodiesterase class I)
MAETVRCGWVELWYQPKIDARAVIMRGVEAFLRIRHPVWGIVPPAYLVPSDGDPRFAPLSESVISRAVEDWYYFFAPRGPIETAINLPMAFLQEPGSISRLCRQLPDNAAFDGLIVEINGAELVKNLNIAKEIRHRLCGGPAEAVDLPPYPRPRRRLWSTHRRRGGRDLGGFPRRT